MRGWITRLVLGALVIGLVATAVHWRSSAAAPAPVSPLGRDASDGVAAHSGSVVPSGPAAAQPRDPRGLPREFHRVFPPGSRIPMLVPRTTAGVRCPDGSYLPLLNGVPAAPPIQRSARLGPVPPVVAKIVDDTGTEWYEHADGSATTTRFREVIADGVAVANVETVHNAALGPTARRRR